MNINPGDITATAVEDRVLLMLKAPRTLLTRPMTPEEVDGLIAMLTTVRDIAAFNRAARRKA